MAVLGSCVRPALCGFASVLCSVSAGLLLLGASHCQCDPLPPVLCQHSAQCTPLLLSAPRLVRDACCPVQKVQKMTLRSASRLVWIAPCPVL